MGSQKITPAPPGKRVFIIVGGTGSGKSTLLRRFYEKTPVQNRLIYDYQGEHTGEPPPTVPEFFEMAKNARNSFIAFEEATIFLSTRSDFKEIREIMVSSRWRNNVVFFVFHALKFIPPNILPMVHAVFVLRTEDELDDPFYKKMPRLWAAQKTVREMKEHSYVVV